MALHMAFIQYVHESQIAESDRVDDQDNILRVHGIHSRVLRLHYELYRELMHEPGPLNRMQREMIAVVVSSINHCHY